jgi:hypothetical protein
MKYNITAALASNQVNLAKSYNDTTNESMAMSPGSAHIRKKNTAAFNEV